METTTRTAWGAYLQTCLLQQLPFTMMTDTTLNEKFDVLSGVAPAAGIYPAQRYYCIGNGAHGLAVGADNIPAPDELQHEATDSTLFKHLPFIMRPVTSDLTTTQQAQYALRQVETYGGIQYACYYLRRMDFTDVEAEITMNTVSAGVTTTTPYAATTSNLNPTPPAVSSDSVNVVSGDYISTASVVGLTFSAQDATELVNCATIIYGDARLAIISEIGLVSGVDQVTTVTGSSGSYNMTEVICAQICSFIDAFYPMKYLNNGVTIDLNTGSTEPLYNLTSTS
ncbi:hypothetical protein [Paraburkholderia sp. BCC1886]|uniref:DUF7208 family protein n=1 Tax=Paraburkholderia sp. BCC1886 TaxID=2562670 RepID=UPI001183C224|nr:hypothetical protein [Paraburkholderia sp. BCC1886]